MISILLQKFEYYLIVEQLNFVEYFTTRGTSSPRFGMMHKPDHLLLSVHVVNSRSHYFRAGISLACV